MYSSKSISRKTGAMVAAGVLATTLGVVFAMTRLNPQASPAGVKVQTPSNLAATSALSSGSAGAGAAASNPDPVAVAVPGQPGGSAPSTAGTTTGGTASGGTTGGTASTTHSGSTHSVGSTAAAAPTASHTTGQSPSTSSNTAAPSGPAPATPGTYHYRQAGSLPGTPAEGTLVVGAASASGEQVWTRNVGGTLPAQTSNMLFNASGAFLLSPADPVTGKASCAFASPVPWPVWPTTPGRSDSATASCSAPISSYQVSSQVQGTAPVTLNGSSMTADVVVNSFVIKGSFNGGAIDVTLTETDEYVPALRVPVVTTTHMTGSALGIPVTTQRTDTLESSIPS